MTLAELEAANARTLQMLAKGPVAAEARSAFPFFGFYEASLFESPPFLMFTANDCPRAFNILYDKEFEPTSMRVWCRLARHATGILDVGAHVGVFSLAAAALRKDIHVHAFEPNPHAYARLRMHIILNGFSHIVEHQYAVGDQQGYVRFGWAKKATPMISSGGGIVARTRENTEEIVVPVKPLDGSGLATTLGARPLVKVDVEGGEVATFSGMREILTLKPDILLETFNQQACDAINPMILPLGYKVYRVREQEGRLELLDQLRPAVMASGDFNQFLSVRSPEEIELL